MAKAPVTNEAPAAEAPKTHFAVFGINEHFTLGLWALDASQLPEGHEAFMRPASEAEVAMARHIIKTLDA